MGSPGEAAGHFAGKDTDWELPVMLVPTRAGLRERLYSWSPSSATTWAEPPPGVLA